MKDKIKETTGAKRRLPVIPVIVMVCFVFAVSTIAFLWGTEAFSPDNIKRAAPPDKMPDPLGETLTIATGGLTNIQMAGKAYYDKYCAVCHGEQGKGDGFNAYNLDPRPKDLAEAMNTLTIETLFKALWDGITGQDGRFQCPPWGRTLGENKINAIISYMQTMGKDSGDNSNMP